MNYRAPPSIENLLAKFLIIISLIAGSVALLSYENNNGERVSVGRRTFKVPRRYLVKGSIPWLSRSQSDGLRFIINPYSRPQEQMLVGVDDYGKICNPSNPPIFNMLSGACQDAKVQSVNQGHALANIRKAYPNSDDNSQWQYTAAGRNNKNRVIATCYALSSGGGLCRSLKNYKDLVFSVGFRDSEIANLPKIWKNVSDMLSSWEEK